MKRSMLGVPLRRGRALSHNGARRTCHPSLRDVRDKERRTPCSLSRRSGEMRGPRSAADFGDERGGAEIRIEVQS